LLIIGVPIFIVGQIYAWWTVLNSTLVLSYMGARGLGLYAMVLVAGGALELLPLAVSQVIYPRMAEQYGRTGRLGDLIRMSIKPTILSVIGIIPLIVVGWFAAEPVIRLVLPNYIDAIPAIRWSLLTALTLCFCPINNVYNVVRRQDLYIVAILLGMGAYVGSLLWLVRDVAVLTAFPQAMLVGRAVFVLLCYVLMIPLVRKRLATR
jgi:O-antigen/teichoic acid export membrane protein